MSTRFEPVSFDERVRTLDVLRGAALLGIALMNIVFSGLPFRAYSHPHLWGGDDSLNMSVLAVQWVLRHSGSVEKFVQAEYLHERVADAACELYASSCTLARLDRLLTAGNGNADELRRDVQAGRYFLTISDRRIRACLAALSDNDDTETTRTADAALERG